MILPQCLIVPVHEKKAGKKNEARIDAGRRRFRPWRWASAGAGVGVGKRERWAAMAAMAAEAAAVFGFGRLGYLFSCKRIKKDKVLKSECPFGRA